MDNIPPEYEQTSTGSGHQNTDTQSKRYNTRSSRNSSSENEKIKECNRKKYVQELQEQIPPSTYPQMPIITSVFSLAQPQTNGPSIVLQAQTTMDNIPPEYEQTSTGSGHQNTDTQSKRYNTRSSRNSSSENEKIKKCNRKKSVQELQEQIPPSTYPQMPIITSVFSLAQPQTNGPSIVTRSKSIGMQTQNDQDTQTAYSAPQPITPKYIQQVIVKPPSVPELRNKSTMCKPYKRTKGVSCKALVNTIETQTDDSLANKVIVPIPVPICVPIYVPCPMMLCSTPIPAPVPFPLPVPVPIFIPTTRNSPLGIMKEIKKIQEVPTDPLEAELKKIFGMDTDSESEDNDNGGNEDNFRPEAVNKNNFDDNALQMASELGEPALYVEVGNQDDFSSEAVDTSYFNDGMKQISTESEEQVVNLEGEHNYCMSMK